MTSNLAWSKFSEIIFCFTIFSAIMVLNWRRMVIISSFMLSLSWIFSFFFLWYIWALSRKYIYLHLVRKSFSIFVICIRLSSRWVTSFNFMFLAPVVEPISNLIRSRFFWSSILSLRSVNKYAASSFRDSWEPFPP